MSSAKVKVKITNKNNNKNDKNDKKALKEVNSKKKFQIFSPELRPKIQVNKIFLDCLSLKDNIVPKQINTIKNRQNSKRKNHSLYKNPSQKMRTDENKFGSHAQNKKKIIINCLDIIGNNKKPNSIFKDNKKPKLVLLSNGSTRKSSDSSPVDNVEAKKEIAQLNKIVTNPSQKSKILKNTNNCMNLKKQNNDLKINTFKSAVTKLNKQTSKSKDKENNIKNGNKIDDEHIINHPQINTFLDYNKRACNTDKKNLFYKSVCSKKIEPLKLFNNDASESSSSVEVDEEEEVDIINIEKPKIENNEDIKMEKEFVMDSKDKISIEELSYEFDENLHKKGKKDKNQDKNQDKDKDENKDIVNEIEKKIKYNNENNNENNSENNNENNNENNKKRNDYSDFIEVATKQKQSCKNMNCKYFLNPNQNQMSNKNIIISSLLTKAGICDDKEKINQDSYIIIENLFSQPLNIYGVFDGHGDNGHLISKFISDFMNHYYFNKLNYYLNEKDIQNVLAKNITTTFVENYEQIIKKCSTELDKEINIKVNYDISQSGSTSVMIYLINDTLICSNVGDSQCILFKCSSDDLWTFEPLSKQHLPSDTEEQKRITENGGEVHPYYDEDGYEGDDRVYAKNQIYPGLSMSRTIGDLEAKKIGVISTPDITLTKITCDSKFLVIGSDGLWDVIKPYDMIRMIRPFFTKGDIEGACQVLMKKATSIWDKNKEERDDITIIVVFIGTPNNYIIKEKHNLLNKIEETENDDKEFSSKKLLKAN